MMKLILEAKDLRKGYGDRELFYIESLTVYDGERIGIIGQNGAGKSTLIHLPSPSRAFRRKTAKGSTVPFFTRRTTGKACPAGSRPGTGSRRRCRPIRNC